MNRRHLVAALAALCVLATGPAAHAADDITGGVLLDGSEIKVAVYAGGITSGRFADSSRRSTAAGTTALPEQHTEARAARERHDLLEVEHAVHAGGHP